MSPKLKQVIAKMLRSLGLESPARSWWHRRVKKPDFATTEQHARQLGASVQYVMDIDPSSPWFQPEFQKRFGGFHAPGEQRTLSRSFPGDRVRSDMLTLLLREITTRAIPGAMAELGVHRGTSAQLLHHYCPERRLYLFDTFSGFAETDLARETIKIGYNQKPQFSDTDVGTVLRNIEPMNSNVIPVVGWFPASITPEIAEQRFAFVHLDADLEEPILAGLEFFSPRLSPGGFIVAHDYNAWPGARLAVDRFLEKTRLAAVPMPDKSGSIVLTRV